MGYGEWLAVSLFAIACQNSFLRRRGTDRPARRLRFISPPPTPRRLPPKARNVGSGLVRARRPFACGSPRWLTGAEDRRSDAVPALFKTVLRGRAGPGSGVAFDCRRVRRLVPSRSHFSGFSYAPGLQLRTGDRERSRFVESYRRTPASSGVRIEHRQQQGAFIRLHIRKASHAAGVRGGLSRCVTQISVILFACTEKVSLDFRREHGHNQVYDASISARAGPEHAGALGWSEGRCRAKGRGKSAGVASRAGRVP